MNSVGDSVIYSANIIMLAFENTIVPNGMLECTKYFTYLDTKWVQAVMLVQQASLPINYSLWRHFGSKSSARALCIQATCRTLQCSWIRGGKSRRTRYSAFTESITFYMIASCWMYFDSYHFQSYQIFGWWGFMTRRDPRFHTDIALLWNIIC